MTGDRRHIAYRQWSCAVWSEGRLAGTVVSGQGLTIQRPTHTYSYTDPHGDGSTRSYDVATWSSSEVTPGFDFTELVPSWNARTPAGTWMEISVAVRSGNVWSQSHVLGRWAEDTTSIHRTSVPNQKDDLATVDVDTLVANPEHPCAAWRLTVSLHRPSGSSATPCVRLVGAMVSAPPKEVACSPPGHSCGTTLDVPAYSQEIHVGEYPQYNGGGEAWCSPASTAMVLAYWQQTTGNPSYGPSAVDYSWVDPSYADPQVDYAAANSYDWSYDGTGNWPFNTAYASRFGLLTAFVTRLRSLREAEQFIGAGVPLIASVTFTATELPGAGYATRGHLLVLAGFTDAGDVVANDPASHLVPSNDDVRTVFARADFERVWLGRSGGIVYIIAPASHRLPAAPNSAERNW